MATKEYLREYRQNNKERLAEYQRNYRKKNPEKVREMWRKYNKKYYEEVRKKRIEEDDEYRESRRKQMAANYIKTKEERRIKTRKYNQENKERIKEYNAEYRAKNRDKIREQQRNANSFKKRARYLGVEYEPIIKTDIFLRDKYECQLCGCGVQISNHKCDNAAHLDHIVPMSKGGGHIKSNVQTLCRSCNLSKQNKMIGQLRIAI